MKAAIAAVLPNMSEMIEHKIVLTDLMPCLATVSLFLRPPGAVITQMLTDTSRVGKDSEHLDLRGALADSLSGSQFVRELQESIPEGRDQVTVNAFHDAAAVDLMMHHSLTPLTASLAQHSTGLAMSHSGNELLGYVPIGTLTAHCAR
jgi:hypothetical protein